MLRSNMSSKKNSICLLYLVLMRRVSFHALLEILILAHLMSKAKTCDVILGYVTEDEILEEEEGNESNHTEVAPVPANFS